MAFPDKPVAQLLGASGAIHAVAYSASPGTYILAGSADRSIRLYNPQPSTAIHPPSSKLGSAITSSSTTTAAALPAPPPEGRLIQTYAAHGYEVLSLAVAADNARFASAGGDRLVFLWDVATATTLRRFGGGPQSHAGRVNCVAFAGESDSVLASGGFDTTVRLWDARSGSTRPVQTLGEARDSISCVAVRGAELVAGSVDGRVRGYDVRAGRVTTDVVGASVTSVGLARDGRTALVGSLDSRVRLMDRESGACLKAYGGGGDQEGGGGGGGGGGQGTGGDGGWKNEELRVQSVFGGGERWVVAGDERGDARAGGAGRVWAWDVLSGKVVAKITVPWGPAGSEVRRKVVGRDGKEKERRNVISCIAWREHGWGDQFCVGGSSGAVTVYGSG